MESSKNLSGVKNILITSKPGCGKTTLIIEILKELNLKASGFYTSEIRVHGKRKGFSIVTLSGKRGILAHQNIRSEKRVSKYGLNLKDLEELGVSSIFRGLKKGDLIIIDEIGKMEIFSKRFQKVVLQALNSKSQVLGTIGIHSDPFLDRIRNRKDTIILKLSTANRSEIKRKIKHLLTSYKSSIIK